MKYWSIALLLSATGGCGAGNVANMLSADGVYTGTNECSYLGWYGPDLTTFDDYESEISRVFSGGTGIPIRGGIQIYVGEVREWDYEWGTESCETTEIIVGDDVVTLTDKCRVVVNGDNTCETANDGHCDEPYGCTWLTDFADCGAFLWDDDVVTTYSFSGDGTISRTETRHGVGVDSPAYSNSTKCSAVLLRQP